MLGVHIAPAPWSLLRYRPSNEDICKAVSREVLENGWYGANTRVAKKYGMSPARVSQIVNKEWRKGTD